MAEAEVEVAFTIERSREKSGGLNLKVFGIGAEGSGKGTSGRADVQRVTLKLHPHVDELVHGLLSAEQIEATREAQVNWYRRSRAPDVPLYVTPDGDLLTSRRRSSAR